ncbi:MAG: hypothetical protein QOJ72_1692 [Nocardioidaceae bacterium]|nr:hypothetical protein [Nocardioidaceae bacterium]
MRKVILSLAVLGMVAAPLSAAHAEDGNDVSIALNHTKIERGDKITVSGHVDGPTKDRRVRIGASLGEDAGIDEQFHGYPKIQSGTHNYSVTFTVKRGGTYVFYADVLDSGGGTTTSMLATSDLLRVYRWTSLDQDKYYSGGAFSTVPDGTAGTTSGKKIAGRSYDHEFFVRDGGTLGFDNFPEVCNSFKGYFGVADNSKNGSKAHYDIVLPATAITHAATHGSKAKLQRAPIAAGTTGISVHATFNEPESSKNRLIVAEPRIHCAIR